MKITDIVAQKNKDRVNIYIDGSFAFGLSQEIRFKYDLFVGKEVDQTYIDDVLRAEEKNKVLNNAFSILSYGQNSKKQIYIKLMKKGYDEEDVIDAIEFCEEKGFINDKLFAESFIRDRTNLKNYGSMRIRYELISKGISKDIIEEVLNLDFQDEFDRALNLAKKRIKQYKDDDKNAVYRKLGGFLYRRGYSYEIVSKVLYEVLNDLD